MHTDDNTVIRYVVTHLSKSGGRVMAHASQGRNTFPTASEAEEHVRAMHENNPRETLELHFGLPLLVRPCKCWPGHFDPKQYYFDE